MVRSRRLAFLWPSLPLEGHGFADEDYLGKPVIGILNTWSDLNTCHSHLRERAEEVKRGIWQAGGFPAEVPVMSLGEMLMKPTTMLYRNLLSMETEETIRCHPLDGVVLMGGCDKTTPALLMGAISANIPAIFLPCGPMLIARWGQETLGSGSDAWKYWAERCAGNLDDESWTQIENSIARSPGHCMTMGTASTMGAIAETLGMTLPGASSIPAVLSEHSRMATSVGRRIVEMAWQDLKPSDIRRCFKSVDPALDCHPKFVAIDEKTDHQIVHALGLGKANCATHQALNSGPKIEVFVLNFLCLVLADAMRIGVKMARVRAPPIGVKRGDAKRFQQGFQPQKNGVLAPSEHIGQYLPRVVINGMPEPSRIRLAGDKTPHFVEL